MEQGGAEAKMAGNSMADIRRRIRSIRSTEHITNAMKLVSAAKLRKARNTFDRTKEYFHYMTESISEIFHDAEAVPEKYLEGNREIVNTCFIIVTSERGLCGAFNANVIREAEAEIEDDPNRSVLIAVGSKGKEYFEKRGKYIHSEYLMPPEDISFAQTREIAQTVLELYEEKKVDRVVLISTAFVNNLEQEVKSVQLLPFKVSEKEDYGVTDIDTHPYDTKSREVEYEPSVEAVFNYLIPKYVEIMLYGSILESATCEHAARRMAMESATDNAREMLSQLSLYYNRARQAAITNEIIEVVSGSEAQSPEI